MIAANLKSRRGDNASAAKLLRQAVESSRRNPDISDKKTKKLEMRLAECVSRLPEMTTPPSYS